ncbi:hypothetical protein N8219_00670, partial [bacterium]|nr:hypothetical protein [bacterium]
MHHILRVINCNILIFLAIICLSHSYTLEAQNFERFSNKEGFNQNTIKSITQDSYGFLWFGTPNGLIKYDGYDFIKYTTQSQIEGQITNNSITYLYTDTNGLLWIGSTQGLNVYVPWLEKFYTVPLPSNLNISYISSSQNGDIWFSGENKIYACQLIDIDKGVFNLSENFLKTQNNFPRVTQFYFTDKNSLMLATYQGITELYFENDALQLNSKIVRTIAFENFKNTYISVIKSIKNTLWIGTSNGLFKTVKKDSSIQIIKKYNGINNENNLSSIKVNTVFEDNNNDIWIATKNTGLLKYEEDQDDFKVYAYIPKNKNSVSSNYINDIFQDSYNVLWIGTAQGGLNKLDITQKPFINYSNNPYDSQSISDNLITSILEDNKGRLWLSSFNKGLFRSLNPVSKDYVNNLKFENLASEFHFSENDIIRCIYEDNNGFIWFGTDFNVVVYNPIGNKFKIISLASNTEIVPNQLYRSILQINDTSMLLCGHEIIVIDNPWYKIQNEKNPVIKIKSRISLNSKIINTTLKDNKGSIWFGSTNGLFRGNFDGGKINIISRLSVDEKEEIRLSDSNIFSLYQSNNGDIWVGTFGGGLNKITLNDEGLSKKIEYFRKSDILP